MRAWHVNCLVTEREKHSWMSAEKHITVKLCTFGHKLCKGVTFVL